MVSVPYLAQSSFRRRSAMRAAPSSARKSPYHCSGTRILRRHMRITSSTIS